MKIRLFAASALAAMLFAGGFACDKSETPAPAAPAAEQKKEEPKAEEKKEEATEEKKEEAAEEKKEEATEEGKAADENKGLSEEEIQKKLEEARAEAAAEAQKKIEEARAEGAAEGKAAAEAAAAPKEHSKEEFVKTYAEVECAIAKLEDKTQADATRLEILKNAEYVLETYVADTGKFKDADADAAKEACMPQMSQEEKDGAINLAIDIGCLRKKEQDAQKMIQVEADLYADSGMDAGAHAIKLTEIKAKDAGVQARIDAAINECPTFDDVQRSKVVGIMVQNKCLRLANVKAERLGALQKDVLDNFELTGAQYAELRTKYQADPSFMASVEEGTKNCPPVNEGDLVTEEEAQKQPASPINGAYSGKVFGAVGGQILLKVADNKKYISGTAQVGGKVFKMSGYVLGGGKMTAQGVSGGDFVRVYGKFGKSFRSLNGSWTGALDGKKRGGSVYLMRH